MSNDEAKPQSQVEPSAVQDPSQGKTSVSNALFKELWNPSLGENFESAKLEDWIDSLQRTMAGSGKSFWELDVVKNKVRWFGSFWEDFGFTVADVESLVDRDVFISYVHPDDRALMDTAVRDAIVDRKPISICYRLKQNTGAYLWVALRARAFHDENGWARYVAGEFSDVSESKKLEESLIESKAKNDLILKATNDGVWEWDFETDVLDFSERCWEQLGYLPGEIDPKGYQSIESWSRFLSLSPKDLDRFGEHLRSHILEKTPFDMECEVQKKDGSSAILRMRAQARYNDEGMAVAVSGCNMDITELKKTQAALILAKTSAEKSNRAKSEFLSSMSHELRTPLNAILGYAQLFGYDKSCSEEQRENVAEIQKAGTHLLQLINDVLDLSQIESGKLNVSMVPVNTSRILDDCVNLMKPVASQKGIELLRCSDSANVVAVNADSMRLKQAVINLLSNAIKYNHPYGSVVVSTRRMSDTVLRISVEDSGIGIPEDKKTEVFESFSRLNIEVGNVEGSGVGLAVTKMLVERMDGEVGFSSVVGEGTTFWLDLKVVKGLESNAVPVDSQESEVLIDALDFSQECNVLYIEDDLTNIKLLTKLLEKFNNLNISSAMEPTVGLFLARTHQPDIILLDINLPRVSGFDLLKILKSDDLTKDIPVVALSANAMSFEVEAGLEAGFYDYLTKPINMEKLISVINSCVAESEVVS